MRLRAFDARVSFCYSLSSMAFFSFFSQQKARQKAVLTNTAKNISPDKQTADTFLAMRMVDFRRSLVSCLLPEQRLVIEPNGVDKRPTFTQIFLLWTKCKRKQY